MGLKPRPEIAIALKAVIELCYAIVFNLMLC
jgi:hypothetical protein